MSSQDLPKPDFAMNMKLIGHSDQGGREDGVQVMVNKGHAFVGHMFSKGFSIIDVRDPRDPKPVKYVPAPHNTWTIHLQTFEDLLLVINARDMFAAPEFQDERKYYIGSHADQAAEAEAAPTEKRDWTAGLVVYDIKNPAEPRRIGFMPVNGGGIHRIWYTGGRWAYVSAMIDGFTDYIFLTVDTEQSVKTGLTEALVPVVDTRHANTSLWLQDGQTVVLGGLRRLDRVVPLAAIERVIARAARHLVSAASRVDGVVAAVAVDAVGRAQASEFGAAFPEGRDEIVGRLRLGPENRLHAAGFEEILGEIGAGGESGD